VTASAALALGAFIGSTAGLTLPYAVYPHVCRASGARWTVCGGFTITQPIASPGGPQALEGYTYVDHPSGTVGLAIGAIGNVEVAGSGAVTSARGLQGGIVISGPGVVDHASSLTLVAPQPTGGYTGPVNVRRADFITFSNGWSVRPDGARILLCDPNDRCRDL
jgi:hypothetical protein